MIRARLRAVLAALALLQPLAAPIADARVARRAAVRPAIWKLTDRDTTIYLFGTIHALPPHFEWETPALRGIVQGSDRLVLEAVIDGGGADTAGALARIGTAKAKLPPLADRVAPAKRARLQAMIARTGVPPATFDGLKTWAAAFVLFGLTVRKLGVSAGDGVEEQLKAQFRAADKPIEGLETLDEQLGYFDTMSEAQQRDFLNAVVTDDGKDSADFGRMLGAWSRGDEAGIRRSFDQDMKRTEALQSVLIATRNRHWAALLADRLAKPGTSLVAVGAGHLVGPGSVQAMLRQKGYAVARVQ